MVSGQYVEPKFLRQRYPPRVSSGLSHWPAGHQRISRFQNEI